MYYWSVFLNEDDDDYNTGTTWTYTAYNSQSHFVWFLVNQELTTTSDVRNTALTTAPDHTKSIKDNKNDEKDPGETKGEATARKNKKARNEASCVLVSPGWCLVLCMGSLLMRTATAR